MLRSKALKDFSSKNASRLYYWWIETAVSDYYYAFVHNFIENPIFQVKRLFQWYWNVFRFDYDFDGHCLFAIIEYKLKRVRECLLNGHAVQEDRDIQAIDLAIKLAGRLKDEKYGDSFHRRHDRKWGKSKIWSESCNDGITNSYWRHSRANANTQEEKDQEYKEYMEIIYAEERKQAREERWLFGILQKYLRRWWD